MFGVLFVCTGNICRSPMAEGCFRHLVTQEGLAEHFIIDSAGITGYHIGEPPDHRAQHAVLKRNFDISGQRARKITGKDFEEYNLILAMDGGHLKFLNNMASQYRGTSISMFMAYTQDQKGVGTARAQDVPDPYYGTQEDFEQALDLIEQGCRGILAYTRREQGI